MELVDWMLMNLSIRNREDAVEYSQRLLDANWISSVNKGKTFKDSRAHMYKFSVCGVDDLSLVTSTQNHDL